MVKQRFLTHFRPWLIAVSKASALIVAYQLFDQVRARFQRPPLNISDVAAAAITAISALALLCGLWAWGEWCWFRLSRFRRWWSGANVGFANHRRPRTLGTWQL